MSQEIWYTEMNGGIKNEVTIFSCCFIFIIFTWMQSSNERARSIEAKRKDSSICFRS